MKKLLQLKEQVFPEVSSFQGVLSQSVSPSKAGGGAIAIYFDRLEYMHHNVDYKEAIKQFEEKYEAVVDSEVVEDIDQIESKRYLKSFKSIE
jgi:hypothetical protein